LLVDLKQRYDSLKSQKWQGRGWFDRWFERPINNARLASFSTYYEQVPLFEELLKSCDNDLARFYEAVEKQGNEKPIKVNVTCE